MTVRRRDEDFGLWKKVGSGKSTVATLPAKGTRDRGYQVLVVDSDESNLGLCRMLGLDTPSVSPMELVEARKGYKDK